MAASLYRSAETTLTCTSSLLSDVCSATSEVSLVLFSSCLVLEVGASLWDSVVSEVIDSSEKVSNNLDSVS